MENKPPLNHIPAWLQRLVAPSFVNDLNLLWDTGGPEHIKHVLRDSPADTLVALATHPRSILTRNENGVRIEAPWDWSLLWVHCFNELRARSLSEEQRDALRHAARLKREAEAALIEASHGLTADVVQSVIGNQED